MRSRHLGIAVVFAMGVVALAALRVSIGGAQARGKALLARSGSGWPNIVWRKYL